LKFFGSGCEHLHSVGEAVFEVEAVLKMWTLRQGSPRNLGLAVAQLSVPIGSLIAFGSPYHSRPDGSASEIRSTPHLSLREHISCVHFSRGQSRGFWVEVSFGQRLRALSGVGRRLIEAVLISCNAAPRVSPRESWPLAVCCDPGHQRAA